MSLRDDLLPVFDDTRALIDDLGFRRYDIMMRVTTWDGDAIGQGTPTVVDTPLTLNAAGNRIKVRKVSSREIIASGDKYADGDFKVGPLTPAFSGGGRTPDYFSPAPPVFGFAEVLYRMTGPGMESGVWFEKVDSDTERNFAYFFVLRRTNVQQAA